MLKIRKKRPCCICRKWFLPGPQAKERQVTCDNPKCKREWHRRQCAKWNKKNADYFRNNYLQKKLEIARQKEQLPPDTSKEGRQNRPRPPCFFRLPIDPIEGVIQTELLVIIDYVIKIQIFHLQKRMRKNLVVNKGSPLH